MKSKVLLGIVIVLTFSMTAAAWDVLGHAFIMEQLKGGVGQANANEIYGITSPDFVNYLLPTPYYNFLYDQTHGNFMALYAAALTPDEMALAYGFVAHNGLWGADYVAHVSSLTGNPNNGYVINKAIDLEALYASYGVWSGMGLDGADKYSTDLRRELCHNIVEYAIDILIWSNDPGIASRVATAAAGRTATMKRLVRVAYSDPLIAYSQQIEAPLNIAAADAILQPAEAAFKQRVITYAGLFIRATSIEQVLGNMDPYLKGLAADMFGLSLLDGQAGQLLGLALQGVQFNDLPGELTGTVGYVYQQLAAHNIIEGTHGRANRARAPQRRGIK